MSSAVRARLTCLSVAKYDPSLRLSFLYCTNTILQHRAATPIGVRHRGRRCFSQQSQLQFGLEEIEAYAAPKSNGNKGGQARQRSSSRAWNGRPDASRSDERGSTYNHRPRALDQAHDNPLAFQRQRSSVKRLSNVTEHHQSSRQADVYQPSRDNASNDVSPRGRPRYLTTKSDKDFLPFEKQSKLIHKRITKTSTVTDAEAKMFQSLLALSKPPMPKKASETDVSSGEGLHSTLSQAIGVRMHQPHTSNTPSFDETRQAAESVSDPNHSKAAGNIRRVVSLFQDAQTDVKMWQILHEQVISPVLDLKLDAIDEDEPGDLAPEVVENLSQAFPKLLVSFQDVLQQSFPSSQYALTVLPYLRSLGPSTFALGASTGLYNHHLRSLYDQRTDLRAMIETLSEMHENVFDFDSTTLSIVERALRNASRATQQPFYNPRNCFWSAGLTKDALTELEAWVGTIKDGITDRALHEARDEQPKTIGYIGQHDDSEVPFLEATA